MSIITHKPCHTPLKNVGVQLRRVTIHTPCYCYTQTWRSTTTECPIPINWFSSQLLSYQLLNSQLLPSYKNLSLVEFNTTCVFVASVDVGYTPQSEWEMGRWTLPISEPWRRWARSLVKQVRYTSFLLKLSPISWVWWVHCNAIVSSGGWWL